MTRPLPTQYDTSKADSLPWVPDQELVRALREGGMPAKDAIAGVNYPPLRLFATCYYYDVIAANKGDRAARSRVDYCRGIWDMQTKREAERKRDGVPQGVVLL